MATAFSGTPRVAFFGGSFDPPHCGHLAIARAAQQALQLDRVLFAPVGLQPLKLNGSSASFEDRVAMTRLAIANNAAFELSLADVPDPAQSQPNFTIDTLTRLRQTLPAGAELFLLLGADSFLTLHHWHRAVEIPFIANLIVASRPGQNLSNLPSSLPATIAATELPAADPEHCRYYRLQRQHAGGDQSAELYVLPNLYYDVSATQIRSQIQNQPDPAQVGRTSPPPLADVVLAYIREHHLYE
jgi:nicotinate-nucleotide adenylyltransferase